MSNPSSLIYMVSWIAVCSIEKYPIRKDIPDAIF